MDVNTLVTELQNESFGAIIEVLNDVPIAVERSLSWNAIGALGWRYECARDAVAAREIGEAPARAAATNMDSTVDALITSADNGDQSAASTLFAALYDELHRLAQRQLAKQQGPAGLGATTLLHEAYLAICDRSGSMFPDRARFMAYAARVMRGLIIDDVRGRLAQKRGGGQYHTALATDVMQRVENPQSLERISDALDELATHDQALAELVDLKFFCGFSSAEIGALRGVSERTVKRDWEKARLYLHRAIAEDSPRA